MLLLVRGVPGSGKTSFVREHYPNMIHIEADMFFDMYNGGQFDPAKLKEAHAWCQKKARWHLSYEEDVAVSNTFTRLWEMQPYIDMVSPQHLLVVRMSGNYQNRHGVPDTTVQKMKRRMEDYPGEVLM